jgi:2'-5' RNA ligase
MRLFIGIPLSPAVLSELSAIVTRLKSNRDLLRWMPPESWHITLQFLGNTGVGQYQCLLARLGEVRSPPVPIHLAELGLFDRAGVFFAGVALTPSLVSLAGSVMAATALCGFVPETRPFHPHITLARAKGQSRNQPLRALESKIPRRPAFTRFLAPEFLLYESHLSSAGATYEVRQRFPLGSVV